MPPKTVIILTDIKFGRNYIFHHSCLKFSPTRHLEGIAHVTEDVTFYHQHCIRTTLFYVTFYHHYCLRKPRFRHYPFTLGVRFLGLHRRSMTDYCFYLLFESSFFFYFLHLALYNGQLRSTLRLVSDVCKHVPSLLMSRARYLSHGHGKISQHR